MICFEAVTGRFPRLPASKLLDDYSTHKIYVFTALGEFFTFIFEDLLPVLSPAPPASAPSALFSSTYSKATPPKLVPFQFLLQRLHLPGFHEG